MKRFILLPDSFKGTMSSEEICRRMQKAILRRIPDAEITSLPIADGGEGTVDAFLAALGGEKRMLTVRGPYGAPVMGFYGRMGDTAVVEMAAAAGLPLVGTDRRAECATTYGVGQLILEAAKAGAKRIIVGLGGSATNDGGCGAAAAAGVVFRRAGGEEFVPVGQTLKDIAEIDLSALAPVLRQTEIIAMCDVDNPLYGPQGAARVFAPQKGADQETVERLDEGLRHLSQVVREQLHREIGTMPGAGAAGGMGGGMVAFFSAELKKGIETVLDTVAFDARLAHADLVFTGREELDRQSLRGKVVMGVARRAKAAGVPVVAVVGDIGDHVEEAYDRGVTAIFSINRVAVPYEQAKKRAGSDLELTMDNILRLLV